MDKEMDIDPFAYNKEQRSSVSLMAGLIRIS